MGPDPGANKSQTGYHIMVCTKWQRLTLRCKKLKRDLAVDTKYIPSCHYIIPPRQNGAITTTTDMMRRASSPAGTYQHRKESTARYCHHRMTQTISLTLFICFPTPYTQWKILVETTRFIDSEVLAECQRLASA